MTEERPAWLRRMENGTIGESRARSFLIDRFWILDRSVDIHGADLVIQRRITTRNLLDLSPPRFGVVQAKFYESNETTQYIPIEYLQDSKGTKRAEFFVLCFAGFEEAQSVAFLTSGDVIRNFREMPRDHSKPGRYELPWKAVFDAKYLVTSPRVVLDRIEQILEFADIISNRQFILGGLPGVGINPHTDPAYELPLDNPHGSVPEAFDEFKKRTNSAMYDVEEFYDVLHQIVSTSDPEVALAAAVKIRKYYGYQVSVADEFDRQYFEEAVTYHKQFYDGLTRLGLLESYLDLQKQVNAVVVEAARPRLSVEKGTARVLSVRYEPPTLKNADIQTWVDATSNLVPSPESDEVLSSVPGHVVVFSSQPLVVRKRLRGGKYEDADLSPEEHARQSAWILARPLMEEVFRHLTGGYPLDVE